MELRTQQVTANDIERGIIRVPGDAKAAFPPGRGEVAVELRGMRLTVGYDPRTGPDRARSGVLRVGRRHLEGRLSPGARLAIREEANVIVLE